MNMKNCRILWVEDDYKNLLPLIEPLRKIYLFDYAVNEREAIALLKEHFYDLIILDIILPEGVYYEDRDPEAYVGLKLLDKIINELKIETQIIVITVVNDRRIMGKINDLGVNKILNKGRIMPSELKKIVEELIPANLKIYKYY
jgi:CheY-like chemotaxis protein